MKHLEKIEDEGYSPAKQSWWTKRVHVEGQASHFCVGFTSMKYRTICGKWLRKSDFYLTGHPSVKCPDCDTLKQALDVAKEMAK